jgi:signal transduction histidine kinase
VEGSDFSDTAQLKISAHEWRTLGSKKMALGFNTKSIWLKIPVASVAAAGKFDILEIKNPHINFLRVWIQGSDSIKKAFSLTGDHLPFAQKTLPERNFSFPISSVEYRNDTIVIAAEKRNTPFSLPVSFTDNAGHVQYLQLFMIFWGVLVGFVMMLMLINVYLFVGSKEIVYLWYGLYLFFILCYMGTDTGMFFEYLYPNLPQLNDLIRPFFFSLSMIPLLLFISSLLELRTYLPKLHRLNYIILFIYVAVFVVAFATCFSGYPPLYQFWLRVQSVLSPLVLMLFLVESIYCVWLNIRFAMFAMVAFISFVTCMIVFSVSQNGLIPSNGFTNNAHYVAIVLDVLIVAFSLVYRYKIFKEESKAMREKYFQQQDKIFNETAIWQQQEMQRMSSLLHDSIGGDIGILRLKTDTMELTEEGRKNLSGLIHRIGDEVRHMSHQFSPLLLKERGLRGALEEIVRRMREESEMTIQFEWLEDCDNPKFKYQLIIYRIVQELLQNIKKHAGATEVMVQITNESSYIGIYVEDNGKGGGERHDVKMGLGLKSIRHLTELLNGKFQIQTEAGKGFVVSVEFEKAVEG